MFKKILLILTLLISTTFSSCDKEKSTSSTTNTTSYIDYYNQPTYITFFSTNYYLGNIDIYINNTYKGTINMWYSYTPACGSVGCVTYRVWGPFTWYAVRRSDGYIYNRSITYYPGCNTYYFY